MGMTIEEAINGIEKRILSIFDNDADHQSLVKAIEIMHKYQKIKEQVNIAIDKENFAISDARLIQIREIINENDDEVMHKVFTKDKIIDILKELQLEIEEKSFYYTRIFGHPINEKKVDLVELDDINDTIQQKINKLRSE